MAAENDSFRWLTDEEQKLWRLMLAVRTKISRTIDIQLQESEGLTAAEFGVLVNLSEAPRHELRLRDLCTSLGWDRSRASHQITRMERRGLVSKVKCAGDARGVMVSLTEDGLRRIKAASPDHVETVRSLVFDQLDPEEIAVLSKAFKSILSADVPNSGSI